MRSHYANTQRLLERVCYVSRAPASSTDLFGNDITVRHTFPYNPDSKTAPDTAAAWAHTRTWDNATRQYVEGPKPEFLERNNDPFNITIIDLDVRSEGGRAYKVIDEANRCFDLREDQVLEVFKHSGILAGGRVPGLFVWGILGSQMRMVLVGGDLHREMVSQAEDFKSFKLKQSQGQTPTEGTLKFGHIYRKRDKSLHLFLGRVKAPGATKAAFAFIKLPNMPEDHHEGQDLSRYDKHYAQHVLKVRDVVQRWDSMTWDARCQWEWHGSHDWLQDRHLQAESGYYHHVEDIVLMSSPKLEEELPEPDRGFAQFVRDNTMLKHRYANGKGDDLAEVHWQQVHNKGEKRQWHYGYRVGVGYSHEWYRLTEGERKLTESKHKERVLSEYMSARAQFQKELQWGEAK